MPRFPGVIDNFTVPTTPPLEFIDIRNLTDSPRRRVQNLLGSGLVDAWEAVGRPVRWCAAQEPVEGEVEGPYNDRELPTLAWGIFPGQAGQPFGAFSFYDMVIESEVGGVTTATAKPHPAIPVARWDANLRVIILHILENGLPVEGGGTLEIVGWDYPDPENESQQWFDQPGDAFDAGFHNIIGDIEAAGHGVERDANGVPLKARRSGTI
jgi:hypothetical protein